MPMKNASSDMKSAARPEKETTRLSALAIGLRLITTAAPKTEHEQREDPEKESETREVEIRLADLIERHWITESDAHFFSFHFNTTPCMTPPISSSFSLSCTISARVKPVMA